MAALCMSRTFGPSLKADSYHNPIAKTISSSPTVGGTLVSYSRQHSSASHGMLFNVLGSGVLHLSLAWRKGCVQGCGSRNTVSRKGIIQADAADVPASTDKREASAVNMRVQFCENVNRVGEQLHICVENCKGSVLKVGEEVETKITEKIGLDAPLFQYMGSKSKELKSEMVGTAESVYGCVIAVSQQPVVKRCLLGFLIMYAFSIAWAARVLLFDKQSQEAQNQFGRELRLQKLREGGAWSASIGGTPSNHTEKSSSVTGRLSPDDEAFRDKVREIREMARAVRLAEQEVFSPADSGFVTITGQGPSEESSGKPASVLRSEKGLKKEINMDQAHAEVALQASDLLNIMRPRKVSESEDAKQKPKLPHNGASSNGRKSATSSSEPRVDSQKETLLDPTSRKSMTQNVPDSLEDSTAETEQKDKAPADETVVFQNEVDAESGAQKARSEVASASVMDSFVGKSVGEDMSVGGDNEPFPKDDSLFMVSSSVVAPVNGDAKLHKVSQYGSAIVSADGAPSSPSLSEVELPRSGDAPPHVNGIARSVSPVGSPPQKFKSMRVITSPEEARARIAAKRAKDGSPTTDKNSPISARPKVPEISSVRLELEVGDSKFAFKEEQADNLNEEPSSKDSQNVKKSTADKSKQEPVVNRLQEEEEWMRDEVLRAIVFKVQDNEQAGRESFDGLDSTEEQLFFKGLERKYEREGEAVKNWIQDRVENLDYGVGAVSVDDPPETFLPRWKDSKSRDTKKFDKFNEERKRIINQQMGMSSPSPQADSISSPSTSSSSSVSGSSSETKSKDSLSKEGLNDRRRSNESASVRNSKTVITSSGKRSQPDAQEWQHTRKWVQELQRKYDMETDPEQRALMEEVGQDLDRWITEDEINEAARLLSKGATGEQEYARMHYEKTREKIRRQREIFGEQAMLNKYGEYKPPKKESELWWLDLPFVLCIALPISSSGEGEMGMYSLDMTPNFEGIMEGKTPTRHHTVAFQDQKEAVNFCGLLLSEGHVAEVTPFAPKDLYEDAKREGFKVTVLKKGKLGLVPGQALESVVQRIIEIGTAVYWEELEQARSIDIDAVLDDGFGYGRSSP